MTQKNGSTTATEFEYRTRKGTWYQRGLWKMWARYPISMWRARRRNRAILRGECNP